MIQRIFFFLILKHSIKNQTLSYSSKLTNRHLPLIKTVRFMNNMPQMDHYMVKEEHSQVFTLRSIESSQQMLEFVPVYYRHSQSNDYKSGHWSAKQHIKYVMFLDYFSHIFTVKHNIKLWKIFTIMSSFIKTRNSSQCRSHHQKTERKYHSIEQILRVQKAKYRNYENNFQKMKQLLVKLPIHNPIQVQVKFQSVQPLHSLKILQEDIQYPILRNTTSLVDMNQLQKSQKSRKNIGSQRIIHYPSEKYIESQVSIQMEHQNDQRSQQRIKEIMYEELQFDYEKEKEFWPFLNSQGDNSQKKDEKFDRTADSILIDANNKTQSQQKPKHDSLPEKKSLNQEQEDIPTGQTLKTSTNLVRKKRSRTRSLLPSYDIVENQAKAHPSQFYKESKKNQIYTPEGKCRTLPPRSFKDDNQESQAAEKDQQKQPVVKSGFSQFVSSLNSAHKEIKENQSDQQQSKNFNIRFQYDQQRSDQQKLKTQDVEKNCLQIKKPQQNLFFCDYGIKLNLQEQISYGQQGEHQDSYKFIPKKTLKGRKNEQQYLQQKIYDRPKLSPNQPVMNFVKKSSQQIEHANQQSQVLAKDEFQGNVQSHSHPYQSQVIHNNSFNQYQQFIHNHHYHTYDYQHVYNPFFIQHSYPMLHLNYEKFIEFYIYFLMQKILMSHMYYDPN